MDFAVDIAMTRLSMRRVSVWVKRDHNRKAAAWRFAICPICSTLASESSVVRDLLANQRGKALRLIDTTRAREPQELIGKASYGARAVIYPGTSSTDFEGWKGYLLRTI